MSRASVSAAIATLTLSLGALAPAGTAHAAASCNAAPKPAAPQGQHWYYRTDRNLGRKCWYLASEGRKGPAPLPAAADDDAESDADAKQATPPMAEAAARLTEPLRSPPPPARPAIDTTTVAQADPNAPIRVTTESIRPDEPAAAAVAQEPTSIVQEPNVAEPAPTAAPAIPPAPAAVPAAAAEPINLMQFVFVAFVALCLLAGPFLYFAAIRRRREIRIVDLNARPLRRPPVAAMSDSPSVAPDASRRDEADVDDEPLRRFAQAWKGQPA